MTILIQKNSINFDRRFQYSSLLDLSIELDDPTMGPSTKLQLKARQNDYIIVVDMILVDEAHLRSSSSIQNRQS